MSNKLTQEKLKQLFLYDNLTGKLISKVQRSKLLPGQVAGWIRQKDSRRVLTIEYRQYLAHQVVWLYINGEWPKQFIDHIDGDPDNNRIENLRLCTNAQNGMNRKPNIGRLYKGVSPAKTLGRYLTRCRKKYIGTYLTELEAAHAYDKACVEMFGEFARPNFLKEVSK